MNRPDRSCKCRQGLLRSGAPTGRWRASPLRNRNLQSHNSECTALKGLFQSPSPASLSSPGLPTTTSLRAPNTTRSTKGCVDSTLSSGKNSRLCCSSPTTKAANSHSCTCKVSHSIQNFLKSFSIF